MQRKQHDQHGTRNEPGNAPGAVTLLLIPRYSPTQPEAPSPDPLFLKAVCEYLEPRRLVTTELFLRGPEYVPIWISVGVGVLAGRNFDTALVREAVKLRVQEFLAPLNPQAAGALDDTAAVLSTPEAAEANRGWPLRRSVLRRVLMAEVSRVPGVAQINDLLLGGATGPSQESIEMKGLQLPRLMGVTVTADDPVPLDQIRGTATDTGTTPVIPRLVPVPTIPTEC